MVQWCCTGIATTYSHQKSGDCYVFLNTGTLGDLFNYRGAEYTCLTRLNDETDITPQENTRFAALCDAGYAKRVSRTPVIRLLRTEKRPFALSFNF